MSQDNPQNPRVDQFILDQIDTVPHLEALLLAWKKRPKVWPVDEMAHALFIPEDLAEQVLRDLAERELLQRSADGSFGYAAISQEQDELVCDVEATYRRELIRVTRLIHGKAPSSLREFARAFRFKKEKD
jgi:hypothetical protein